MPKQLLVDPSDVRRSGMVFVEPIPVNRPGPSPSRVAQDLGERALISALRDMHLIRQFETALDGLKRFGRYGPIEYRYGGPAHLAIGQEAAAVGQALGLGVEDHIFGSHRSHAEFIAKGAAAIRELGAQQLGGIFDRHQGVIELVERNLGPSDHETRGLQFMLYGLLAEIFGKANGFNRGMGGSMHAFFPPFGIYPNNAIVGGSAPIATGAALHKRVHRQLGVTVANIGDAAAGCGPVWESLNFAAMGQLTSLWPDERSGGLPVIFFFMNNFYGMGGQTIGETMAFDRLSRIGAGVNRDNLHAETIDGNDPLAVFEAIRRAKSIIASGDGPILIDCQTYRQSGHSPSDASSYRSKEELELWRSIDPIAAYGNRLEAEGLLDRESHEAMSGWARERVVEVLQLAADPQSSPYLDPAQIESLMWSREEIDLEEARRGWATAAIKGSPRHQQLETRARSGLDGEELVPAAQAVQMRDALFEAIAHHAVHDDRLIIYGEENRDWGGAFGVYRGLTEILPYHRLFNAPISEAAIIGTAVGFALEGGRALVELMYSDFIGRAGDEIFNQLAKWQAMSGGTVSMPVVVRVSVGSTYGAQHSQEWTSLAAHIPGLKVVFPATPYDAKGLMASALAGNDPVLFFESQSLYGQTEIFRPEGVPSENYRVPIGVPRVVREGDDVTILTVGAPLYRAVEAATILAAHGVGVEVIDARTLVPFDYTQLILSVRKTGRFLGVTDGVEQGNYLATMAMTVQQNCFEALKAPATVVGAPATIVPPSDLTGSYFPDTERIITAVESVLER